MTMRHDDTRLTASLPNLDIEFGHLDAGEEGEVVTIRLRAVPDMDTAIASLASALPFAMALPFASAVPFASALPFAMTSSNPLLAGAGPARPLAAGPMSAWLHGVHLMWRPWLAALGALRAPAGE